MKSSPWIRHLLRPMAVGAMISCIPLSLVFRLGALVPRDRVLYYYLSIVRRARQSGFPRLRDQTPYEYGAVLTQSMLQARREMAHLTQAFVEARYSQKLVGDGDEERVRADWQQVKAALRALRASTRRVTNERGDTT